MSVVLLVDGNSIAWRAFHGAPPLRSPHTDEPTGMAYVFLNMLRSAVMRFEPRAAYVVWDGGRSKFRTDLYPAYKHRHPTLEPSPGRREEYRMFDHQLQWLNRMLPRLGVTQCVVPDWEADDVVAMFALASGAPRIVFSGDRDFWQLVSPRISVLYPKKEHLLTPETFPGETPVTKPVQWLVYRVLSGDHGDNIPGIGSVGPKRALAVARSYTHTTFSLPCLEAHLAAWRSMEWLDLRRTVVRRNVVLMSLVFSAKLLAHQLRRGSTPLRWMRGEADLDAALPAIEEAGMSGILSKFLQWSEPFTLLQCFSTRH